MAKKVTFTGDYTGQWGRGVKGQIRNISDEAFEALKAKGLVNVYHEKELKVKPETKELKITGKETK